MEEKQESTSWVQYGNNTVEWSPTNLGKQIFSFKWGTVHLSLPMCVVQKSLSEFYYEVELLSAGKMQLGWEGWRQFGWPSRTNGVGDDVASFAYDSDIGGDTPTPGLLVGGKKIACSGVG